LRKGENVDDQHSEYDYPCLLRLRTDSRKHHILEGGVVGEQGSVSENSWHGPFRLSRDPYLLSDLLQPIHEQDRRSL